MAGEVGKKELAMVLREAMLAQKSLRPHCDRLLQLLCRLRQPPRTSDDHLAARLREFALDVEHINPAVADRFLEIAAMRMDLTVTLKHVYLAPKIGNVSYMGIEAGARHLTRCLDVATANGARLTLGPDFAARLALGPDFADMAEEQLYDAVLSLRLPACPTTQMEAFSRVEAAFSAVKLAQEHHIPRCIQSLGITDEDDPVSAATEHLAKTDLSDDPATGEHPLAAWVAMPSRARVDVDKACDYLDRACTLVSLAVSHIDLAVAVISSFLDPNEVASISEFTDRAAQISEDRFLHFTAEIDDIVKGRNIEDDH